MRSGRRNFKILSMRTGGGRDCAALIAPLRLLNFKKQLKIFIYNRRLKQGVLMKKFYLKISLFTFITAFVVIPAAAKSHLTSLIKLEDFNNEEQRMLFKSCDYGDGKYGSCNKLVEILSKECDDDRRYLSCELNALLLLTLNRDEKAINYLVKSCDANLMTSCLCLNWEDLYFTGNTDRVLKSFKKICSMDSESAHEYCGFYDELKICMEDKECNPRGKMKEIYNKLYGELK